MYHRIDLIFRKDPFKTFPVTDITFISFQLFTGDFLNPVKNLRNAVVIVIRNDNIIACLKKLDTGMTSDIACAACNQNCHISPPFPRRMCAGIFI